LGAVGNFDVKDVLDGSLLVNDSAFGNLLVKLEAFGSLLVREAAFGSLLVNDPIFGILEASPLTPAVAAPIAPAPGILEASDDILGIPFGTLTRLPRLPIVSDEKFGFLTPDNIPSIPFGFGILIFGKSTFGKFTFGRSTFGKLGRFGFGRLGAFIFGTSIFGIFGTDGTDGTVKFGADIFGIEKSFIYQSSDNVPPSYPGAPPPPTVNTLVLIRVGNESRSSVNCCFMVFN
jgi:hypothetical protein